MSPRLASLSSTRAFTACCLTLAATVAVAQPLPAPAQPLPAAAPAPAPETSPVMPTPLPGATPWSPVDDEGWPRGVSLEDLRGLRPCDLGERLPGPGEPIPCRPMARPEPVQWRWGLDWTVGAVFGRPTTTGASHALGVEVDVTRARSLALGVRYELGGYGLRGGGDEIQLARGQRFLGQVRWRAFTDEVDRDAWAVVAGAGYQLAADALGGDGPVARVGLAREIGLYLDDENAGVAALELAYSRGLTADAVEAVTASARFGFEFNIVEPRNVHRVDRPWSERAWTGADVYASPFMLGLGVSLGARLSPRVHAVATGNYVFGRAEDSTELEGLHGALAVQAGVRLGAGWPAPAPLFVQLQAGPAAVATDAGLAGRWLADAELAFSFGGCGGAVAPGVRLRADVTDGVDALTGALVLNFALGRGAGDGRCGPRDRGPPVVYMPTEPPPPPAPPPPAIATAPTPPGPPPPVAPPVLDATGSGTIAVAVPRPTPIVIEVALGAVALGGLVEVRLDPRLLPLPQLVGADVDVVLEGPAEHLGRLGADLSAMLARHQVTARGWAIRPTGGAAVRAVFTIYPPGSR